MGTINPDLVPTLNPGTIFDHFTEDTSLNIRWLGPNDPGLFEALNRPLYDIALRQLIVAKAIDNLELRLAFMSLFPFLIPPVVIAGSAGNVSIPLSWIWDMHVSVPSKWQYLRLANIKRLNGLNGSGSSETITGQLRLTFSGQEEGSATEIMMFHVDYRIDSPLSYQIVEIVAATSAVDGSYSIDPSEAESLAGFLIFRTLDTTDATNKTFLTDLAPSTTPSEGPATYWLMDNTGSDGTFISPQFSHGTGLLVLSAFNEIPPTDSDFNSWLSSNNYPFRLGMARISTDNITIPQAIFSEFSLVVPSPDAPSNDVTKLFSPVWLSSIERIDTMATQLRFVFSTNTILNDGNPQVVEFASMILLRSYLTGQIVNIEPITNLLKNTSSDQDNFLQGFGTGHVVLSKLWTGSGPVDDFFQAFMILTNTPAVTYFTQGTAILSSYGLNRVPRYVPTVGQSDALVGSTARWTPPIDPSNSNRYVTEKDQGQGQKVDFSTLSGYTENTAIENIAYKGSLNHRIVTLIVDSSSTTFDYKTDILPRLTCLLGRAPAFGDYWWDGTYLKFFNGDAWMAL